MKTILLFLLSAVVAMVPRPLAAQATGTGGDAAAVQANLPPSYAVSILREKEGRLIPMPSMFLFKLEGGKYIVADNPQGARFEPLDPAVVKFMSIELPEDMTEALAAYEKGEYAQALPLLENVVNRYQAMRALSGSMVEQAEIYRLDCFRRTRKTKELRDALAVTKPENYGDLGKEYLLVWSAWDAYAAKDWKRIEIISKDIDALPPGTPAAELAFLRAEALKQLDKKAEALAEYHRAMAMDFTRSRDVFGDAAIAALELYNELPATKDFFERYGSPDYNPEAAYVIPTKEAALLAHLVRTLKPGGRALPTALSRYTKAFDDLQKEKKPADGDKK